VEANLLTCSHPPFRDEIRMTRSVLGPDALPPHSHPIPPWDPRYPRDGAPSPIAGTSNPTRARPPHPDGPDGLAPAHGTAGPGHPGTLHPATGPTRPHPAAHATPTCPDGCATLTDTPLRGHQSWLRHRQLVIGKRSPEYQALRSAGLAGAGTTTPRIDHPSPSREWGRRYHAWRKNLHRWAAIDLALPAPTFPKGEGPRTWAHGRSRSCPARLDHPTSGRGPSLLSSVDVESNLGPPPMD